ncbi:putative transcriptional regulator, ArsR family [Aeropyrum pernix]|uniref:Putative transcriptional regulator, ArsR family n=1 Tax=Aeropyrum pernix TaxID=56636 RepID=A0A401HAX3_AERPX|nr:winged helix-turn-helix domain-containing protein [Aeropyrum pernix]GBF09520.1 putative transcriptional regulator, ArsR family [Aeropyrum pernix]
MPSGVDGVSLLVRWLIEGSRGGVTRARILMLLRERPRNAHQLSQELGLNYRTVLHHLEVLARHGLIARLYEGYGAPYALTSLAERHWSVIEDSIRRVGVRL